MNLRRWGMGGMIAMGVVAAACGGSGALDGLTSISEDIASGTAAFAA